MNRIPFILIFVLWVARSYGQPHAYTVANAHSHNDYENPVPFHTAYHAGFGSIEVDIFLLNDELYVAHDSRELQQHRRLEPTYLQPLITALQKNNGHPYTDSGRSLQILVDIKTDPSRTLNKLISTLEQFPSLTGCPGLKWVISGNRPDPYKFSSYPSFISFDGDLGREYSKGELSRIAMMSGDFRHFSSWDGQQEIPEMDESKLKQVVHQAHLLHKPVRFWDAPDFKNAWYELMLLEVDFINTDHIEGLAKFLEEKQ